MANITLTELHVAGSELFQDSESFLNEMTDVDAISGGYYGGFSNLYTLEKLTEAYVNTYGIGHIAYLAKSYSDSGYGY
ncbi:hypothetical protein IQ259_14495 [Fortiea sp. LEGE XX443]|uniref:hypothetical protein n=1 Tax=Fortiea sp. LEGE XX443 TaxID=1828611 RepID=UPI001881ED5F|nr:hypothetical protein [Fortiea sp. LEGE XX443]MBE9006232.1 hypothetical protein [Fortiea sp. LEGE XX443]